MSGDLLGELEHRILLALRALGPEAYTVSVAMHLEALTGRDVALATLHVSLRRLEAKGYVRSSLQRAPAEEGGRERRCYAMTSVGHRRLDATREELNALWRAAEAGGAG